MNRKYISIVLSICLFLTLFFNFSVSSYASASKELSPGVSLEQANQVLQSTSSYFTENKGQWHSDILFAGNTDFGKIAFTKDAVYYNLTQKNPEASTQTVKLSFVNAELPCIEGQDVLPHYNNYFLGNDASKWATECRNYAQITYTHIWQGIDLAYFFTPQGLKYEYYVHPGANLQDVQVHVTGADVQSLGQSLELFTTTGTLKDDQLFVYGKDSLTPLDANFQVHDNTFSFAIDNSISTNETIVIDPLVYSTFLGGSSVDQVYSMAIDTSGNAYIVGETDSTDFQMNTTVGGALAPGYDQTHRGSSDAFVVKLNPSGTEILYATFLGGSSFEEAHSVAVDAMGNAYISGRTNSPNFPMHTTVGGALAPGYDQTFHGNSDVFVVKLNPSGTELLYSTFLGGSSYESGHYSLAIDDIGNAYVTGGTSSSDFPIAVTVGGVPAPGYDQTLPGNGDAFVVKLNPSGTELLYATFLGGSGYDRANSIAVDAAGQAYVIGYTESSDFPITVTVGGALAPGYDQTYRGGRDAFVVKLNSSGTELLYSTYLGADVHDYAQSIAIDDVGNAYLTGYTTSPNFPMSATVGGTSAPGYDQTHNGDYDTFVVKLNPSGTELLYATFLGGFSYDQAKSIAVDAEGHACVAGFTASSDFPMSATVGGVPAPGYDQTLHGFFNTYVVKLNPSGTELLYATFLGGTEADYAAAISIDDLGNAYVAGSTISSDFPMNTIVGGTAAPGYDQTYNGNTDGFVVKIGFPKPILEISVSTSEPSYRQGDSPILNVNLTNLGDSIATSCDVLITLPPELAFSVSQTTPSTPANGNRRIFHVGNLSALSSSIFAVYLDVVLNVPTDTTVPLYFDATCLENATDNTTFLMTLLHTPPPVPCPELFIKVDSDKTSYMFEEFIRFTITLDNDGGPATNTRLEIDLPPEVTYQSIDTYPVLVNGQHLLISIGTIDELGSTQFHLHLKVTTPVQNQTIAPMYMDLFANECGTHMSKTVNVYLTPKPRCPNLTVETTPNKPNYYYGDLVYLNVTLRNLGGQATSVKLELDLPPDLSYAGCDKYRAVGQGQHQTFTIGTMEPDSVLRFVIYAQVVTDVKVAKSIPILLELTAHECDSLARRLLNIKLEPKRTSQQNLDLSVKLLNLEFDEEAGQYYLPFDQTLELQLQVFGYETYYNYTIHWGDGETTTLNKETSATILLKHKFTAKGTMHLKITIQDPNGREKTSTLYLWVK